MNQNSKTAIIVGSFTEMGIEASRVFKQAGFHIVGIDKDPNKISDVSSLDEMLIGDPNDLISTVKTIHKESIVVDCQG